MCDEYKAKKLLDIKNRFLCCVPVTEIGLKKLQAIDLTWDDQEFLLNATINNSLIEKYPIKPSYQKAFLKLIITHLESNYLEIHDSLYSSYCNILNQLDTSKYYFKHYCINNNIITLKENKNFISEGTTGLYTWQASLALSEYCLNNLDLFQNKVVLELGSGVGLVGITVALSAQPSSIYLTDCHPKVLTVLSENVQLNCQTIKETSVDSSVQTVKETFRARFDSTSNNGCAGDSLSNDQTVNGQRAGDSIVTSNQINKTSELNNETIKNYSSRTELLNFDGLLDETSNNSKSGVKHSENCLRVVENNRLGNELSNFDSLLDETVKLIESDLISSENCINVEENAICVELFDSSLNVISKTVNNNTSVYVLDLAWETVNEGQCSSSLRPDFVLAADVVYDNSVFEPLCGAVKFFLNLNQKCQVVFALTERNPATLKEFLSLLEINKLLIQEIPCPTSKYFFWSTETKIRFFLVSSQ